MYKVTHIEDYLPESVIVEYESIDAVKERYSTYDYIIDEFLADLQIGDSIEFMYDHYINLIVERY